MNDTETALADDEIDAGGKIEVLDPTGHFEIKWGRKKAEVEAAEKTFIELLAKGYLAFKKTWTGKKGKKVVTFDAKEGSLIFDQAEPEEKAVKLPLASKDKAPKDAPKGDVEKDKKDEKKDEKEGDPSYEQTKKFDKKAEHTMTPPMRGG